MDFKEILCVTAILSSAIPAVILVSVVVSRIIRQSDLRLPKTLFCLFAVLSIMTVIPTALIVFNPSALDTGIVALFFFMISVSAFIGTVIGFFLCWLLMRLTTKQKKQ